MRPPFARLDVWLHTVYAAVLAVGPLPSAPADPLAQLSPRKLAKHAPPADSTAVAAEAIARCVVGRLLAVRGLAVVGGAAWVGEVGTDVAAVFAAGRRARLALSAPHLCDADAVIAAVNTTDVWREIAALPADLFRAESIAALPQQIAGGGANTLRKRAGIFHTPAPVARRLAEETLEPYLSEDQNPTILDPACGGGVLLLAAYDVLTARGMAAGAALACLYGVDLDPLAVDMARLALARRAGAAGALPGLWARVRPGHALIAASDLVAPDVAQRAALAEIAGLRRRLFAGDGAVLAEIEAQTAALSAAFTPAFVALPLNALDDWQRLAAASPFEWSVAFPEVFARGGFAAVLANPPFVGFNDYSGVEKALYSRVFPQVYTLKSDLLYYFLARGVALLRDGGRLGYITSRFWQAAAHAHKLRAFLAATTEITLLADLDPATTAFADAQIDACLLVATKRANPAPQLRRATKNVRVAEIAAGAVLLGDIAACSTGVQTGCDAAFVLSPDVVRALPPELVRPLIKSAEVGPFRLDWAGRYLLYVDRDVAGDDEAAVWERWPALAAHLAPFRERLAARRRYAAAFPPYAPQWPRRRAIFETQPKIVTPYKAPRNSFALDPCGFFFSTDVVAIVPRPAFAALAAQQALVAVLNSHAVTVAFRVYAKRVGGGQYDYYANPVKRLPVPASFVAQDWAAPAPAWANLAALGQSLAHGTARATKEADGSAALVEIERLVVDLFRLGAARLGQ